MIGVDIINIITKEANLFVKSNVSEQYQWLKKVMMSHGKMPKLSKKQFNQLTAEQKEILSKRWYELFEIAQSEWKTVSKFQKNETTTIIDCQLCGKKELDLISVIENMENNNRLIVGSTCILKFDKINNNNSLDYKKYREANLKNKRRIENELLLEEKYNGILSTIEQFKKISSDRTVILSQKLDIKYGELYKIIINDYELQLQQTSRKVNFNQIKNIYKIVKEFLDEVEKYKFYCNNSEWGINDKVARWCYTNNDLTLINLLKNFGEINIYTIDQIKENDFLNNIILKYKSLLLKYNIKLYDKRLKGTMFNISFNITPHIILDVDTIEFLKKEKGYLFNERYEPLTYENILKISNINFLSYDAAANHICKKINLVDNTYQKIFSDISINEISFTKLNKIYVLDYENFIKKIVVLNFMTD